MIIYGYVLPGAVRIANWASRVENLTPRAKYRLKIIDWHRSRGSNISLTARHFGLTRKTLYKWLKRFDKMGIKDLNDKSKRPHHLRKPAISQEIVFEIVKTRKQYPAWSKYKIKTILERKGINISASSTGRILKRRGLISCKISRKRQNASKHPRMRFPRGLRINSPGDMVQMDTKYVNLVAGRKIYQFTAIDVLSKRRVLRYYRSLSSKNGKDFLKYCLNRFPFEIKAVQTDNGPEFLKEFDKFCKEKNLPHYFIYPRTPKQNSYVENSHFSDKREFYLQGNVCFDIEVMNQKISEWEKIWNEIRPHESLNYLTPDEYLNKWRQGRLPTKDTIVLQT